MRETERETCVLLPTESATINDRYSEGPNIRHSFSREELEPTKALSLTSAPVKSAARLAAVEQHRK
ncbi:hypothetical protein JCGZ_08798 [Jatropha curcas]|uniref:Uncharacterized protein n=1 Tax=Jatropha curcas TaxID=180498 RepID=A0A067KWE2_JATCU|nr:hypothetical protein JCGZ_08798 [Jatropha curcas]